MPSIAALFLVCISFPAIRATQLTQCEVYEAVKPLDGYRGVRSPEWTCVTFHSSGHDTQAVVKNNGSTEFGIFQISNDLWCLNSEIPESENICGLPCAKLLDDDLADDIICVKKILDSRGIGHWKSHKSLCSDNLEQWRCDQP